VAFSAIGPLDADNADGVAGERDLYVRSLASGTTHMVSVTTTGARGGGVDGPSIPAIDRTGTRAAFVTSNKLDAAADGDTDEDAYVRNRIGLAGEATQLATVAAGQTAGPDAVRDVALSDDSNLFAFSNGRIWITGCDANACSPAIRWDEPKTGGSNLLPNVAPFFARPMAGGVPQTPNRVYLRTRSALDPVDTDGADDIYGRVIDKIGSDTGLHLMTGGAVDGGVLNADATDDGTLVVFDTRRTTNLPGSDATLQQVFGAVAGPAFENLSQLAGAPRVNGAGDAFLGPRHATSDDGRVVAFTTRASALGSPTTRDGHIAQTVVRDIAADTTTVASVATDGVSPADGDALAGGVDATGRRVAFLSSASNLVAGVGAGVFHAYVRDLATRTTTLLDRTAAGTPATDGAFDPVISADGTKAVFLSRSPDLGPAGGIDHVFVVDLATGAITLADRAANGTPGDGDASEPDISGDGSRVSFISRASNLPGGTPAPRNQVYVRDLGAGTTTWVSVPEDGDPTHSYARSAVISRDGLRLAFIEEGPEFGFGAPNHDAAFVRDLVAGTTTLVSIGPNGPADRSARTPSLSAGGTTVAFTSDATNLPGGSGDGLETAYVHDLTSHTTVPVAQGRGSEQDAQISGNGACVAFASHADDLVSPSYGPDDNHVFLHALHPTCAPSAKGAGRDTTRPVITRLRATHRRFAVTKRRTARIAAKAKRGTTFIFRLSENARTTITIDRRLNGRRRGKRCVRPRAGLKRKCTRLVRAVTLIRARTVSGTNRVAYSGRVGKRALAPGSYLATVRATDVAGNRSAPRSLKLTVVAR
jgi:Tol biopolymer transport system component